MSEEKKQISGPELQRQVAEYSRRRPEYETYAQALKRVLEKARKASFPDAFVQAREKSVSSFAEKAVRKYEKYPDAVNQLTDLCGGRVIVQTLDQVKAVRKFIDTNFAVLEADEKGVSLGEDRFGYRDMHYLVRLIPEKASRLGFTPEEINAIGDKTTEIQIRTWVQHAWADTLHDRMYKTKLRYPAAFRREGSLLAAIMEDGDRAFNRLAGDIDGMLANFNAYASQKEVERELDVQKLIFSTADDKRKPEIALQIARLLAPQGDYAGVTAQLSPYADVPSPLGCAIRSELGFALCQLHRTAPQSPEYQQGQAYLQRVVDDGRDRTCENIPDLRRKTSTLARALARLAWTYEAADADAHKARACFREALELEPANPYYLADVIGHEISYSRRQDFVGAMPASIRQAIATCQEHLRNGTEMPFAAFTAGRLHLLLGESDVALGEYARGIRHVMTCTACTPPNVLAAEKQWLILVTKPDPLSGGYSWAMELLRLAEFLQGAGGKSQNPSGTLKTPVLIVTGGAASLKKDQADLLRPMLVKAFTGFTGTIYSGGTRVGVPGCVGDAAEAIGPRGQRPFMLAGYLPRVRPDDAPEDERYDQRVKCGEKGFSPEQILKNWADILAAGIPPDEIRVLGFGGGSLSAVEYRIALGLGALVGIVEGSGGTAEAMLKDELWASSTNLISLPCDPASIRALVQPPRARPELNAATVEKMGMAFHEEYRRNNSGELPDNMQTWDSLKETFRKANLEQAKYSVQILEACGFEVVPVPVPDKAAVTFTDTEVNRMAELEHGRWNVERLLQGWRLGPRDNDKKFHNCLVPWSDDKTLTEKIKGFDRAAVRKFPEVLARAGLEVRRKTRP